MEFVSKQALHLSACLAASPLRCCQFNLGKQRGDCACRLSSSAKGNWPLAGVFLWSNNEHALPACHGLTGRRDVGGRGKGQDS